MPSYEKSSAINPYSPAPRPISPVDDFMLRTNEALSPVTDEDGSTESSSVRLPRHEEAHIPGKWKQAGWIRAYRRRRKEKLKQDAAESKTGVTTFLTMAKVAINLAVKTESNSDIRPIKRRMLQDKWREYQQELLGIIRR